MARRQKEPFHNVYNPNPYFVTVKWQRLINILNLVMLHSGGSRISRRGRPPGSGGADSWGGYVSKNLYVEMKESGPLGGAAGGIPWIRQCYRRRKRRSDQLKDLHCVILAVVYQTLNLFCLGKSRISPIDHTKVTKRNKYVQLFVDNPIITHKLSMIFFIHYELDVDSQKHVPLKSIGKIMAFCWQ